MIRQRLGVGLPFGNSICRCDLVKRSEREHFLNLDDLLFDLHLGVRTMRLLSWPARRTHQVVPDHLPEVIGDGEQVDRELARYKVDQLVIVCP